jgi:secreted trypsin-like serine protease
MLRDLKCLPSKLAAISTMKLFVTLLSLVAAVAAAEIGVGGRISGGEVAGRNQFPYMVGLFVGLDTTAASVCGASIISANFLLTAAHCVFGRTQMIGVFGGTDIMNANQPGQVRHILTNFIIHPNYDSEVENSSDMALVGTPTLTYNGNIVNMFT